MQIDHGTAVMERLLGPVGRCLTPEVARELLQLRADAEAQARIEDLATRNAEGALAPEEREEYEAYVWASNFVAILQAQARAVLRNGGGGAAAAPEAPAPEDAYERLERGHNREPFFEFVRAFIADREYAAEAEKRHPAPPYGPDAGGWENVTIEAYLDAALAWARATAMGVSQGLPEEPSWKAFATFLYCGKVYE